MRPEPEPEYESVVDFSAHGATRGQIHPVVVAGEIVRPRAAPEPKKAQPFYEGEDGATLAGQPHHHRERWIDRQWAAFEEHKATSAAKAQAEQEEPLAVAVQVING